MFAYTVRRLIQMAFVLFGLTVLMFVMLKAMPGDPAKVMAGLGARPETIAGIRVKLGLDQPLPVQYWKLVSGLFNGLRHLIIPAVALASVQMALNARLTRVLEVINAIPFLVLALLVVSLFGSSVAMLILVLGVFGIDPARIIRSEVLSIRENDYVLAARALGVPTPRIIMRHVMPNAIASLIVVATMYIGVNIIIVAGLSFLGFGVRPPTPSWGSMLQEAQAYMRNAWWMAVFPGLCIVTTVFGFNILGDSLRDVLDPRLK